MAEDLSTMTGSVSGHQIQHLTRRQFTRRRFLLLAGLGASASLLAACGQSAAPAATSAPAKPAEAKPTEAKPAAPAAGATTAPAAPAAAATTAPAAKPAEAAKPAASGEAAKKGGTMRIGFYQDASNMDPAFSGSGFDRQVFFNVLENLVTLSPTLEIQPGLAESWQIAQDGKSITFKLKQGVKFHDGTDFNAEAVKANYDRILDPEQKSPRRSDIASVQSVDMVDPNTIRMNMSVPDSSLLANLTDRSGMIISPESIKKYGKDLARNVVGTGPFQFVEWAKDDHILLKKNPNYWNKEQPNLDEVRYRVILDDSVRMAALKNNELDMVDVIPTKFINETKADTSLVSVDINALGGWWVLFNCTKPPFDNKALREAVVAAMDLDAILKIAFRGIGQPANGPLPPSSWAYDNSIPYKKRDVNLAKQKLTEGGKPGGFKFAFQCENIPIVVEINQLIKSQLSEIVVDADVQPVEVGTLLADRNSKNFELSWTRWSGRPDPDGNTYAHFHSKGGMNFGGYANAKVDEALDKARQILDHAERRKLYTDAIKVLQEDVPVGFLWHPVEPKAMSKAVRGYVAIPDGMIRCGPMSLA
jgi:peptide/nickel transport system substrate-binding protein